MHRSFSENALELEDEELFDNRNDSRFTCCGNWNFYSNLQTKINRNVHKTAPSTSIHLFENSVDGVVDNFEIS